MSTIRPGAGWHGSCLAGIAVAVMGVGLGCGPWGPRGILPGGPFVGSARTDPVPDWSFSDEHPLIAIETRGSLFRHSVTIVCIASGGKLYVMARHAPRKRWVQNMEADPRVRLRVGEGLYAGRAVRVRDEDEAGEVVRAFLRKYVGLDVERARALGGPPASGDDRAEVWTWRIDPMQADS